MREPGGLSAAHSGEKPQVLQGELCEDTALTV